MSQLLSLFFFSSVVHGFKSKLWEEEEDVVIRQYPHLFDAEEAVEELAQGLTHDYEGLMLLIPPLL